MLDTPGLLDRPLEERNTIEMTAVTALAHLRCAVLYLVDASEACGYSLAQQAALFHSIKPLFANKPLLVVVNKTDARPLDCLRPDERALLDGMEAEARRISGGAGEGGATKQTRQTRSPHGRLGRAGSAHAAAALPAQLCAGL